MFKLAITCILSLIYAVSYGQSVGINNDGAAPDASAILDIKSNSKGILFPRMTFTQRNLIPSPATGLMIYQTDDSPGIYYYSGGSWVFINGSAPTGWSLTGNNGTDPENNFIGTIDNKPLRFRLNNLWAGELNRISGNAFIGDSSGRAITSGILNAGFGHKALKSTSSGYENTAIGVDALAGNTAGTWNTAIGSKALMFNTSGISNTAIGASALLKNTGSNNTATGTSAMYENTTGNMNTAVGSQALRYNTTGIQNTGLGMNALVSNTAGAYNTAVGVNALYYNVSGQNNTAVGTSALFNNTGSNNTAVGSNALTHNTASNNTATGLFALYENITGVGCTAIGSEALRNSNAAFNTGVGYYALLSLLSGDRNTAIGYAALLYTTTGEYNVGLGQFAMSNNTTGSDNVAIGSASLWSNSTGTFNIAIGTGAGTNSSYDNTVSIGNSGYLNGGNNQILLGNLSTTWNGGNIGWSTYSDARVKTNIHEDVKGLDFITRLRPVTYHRDIDMQTQLSRNAPAEDYPTKYDIQKIKFSGFLAQEVEQAALASGYDFSGITKPSNDLELYTLSYESFVVPLVKAVQELHLLLEEQQQLNQEQQRSYHEQLSAHELLLKKVDALETQLQACTISNQIKFSEK